ncbi:hypothetical protein F5B19DRAFT_437127 [Rostrohypoxylon terebratum]|nr:hypothetical protein F5B19DRAFT_437127 [Rostrohypoxylon terebratum]
MSFNVQFGARVPPAGFDLSNPNNEKLMEHNKNILRLFGYHVNTEAEVDGAQLAMLASAAESRKVRGSPVLTFEPFYFFFYGSLQHPKVLTNVTKKGAKRSSSEPEPVLKPGSIKDWKIMMWGPYPALIPKEGNKVEGKYWKCESIEEVYNLCYYETDAYRMEFCDITTEEGEVIKDGRVFVSTDEDGSELTEGCFDLEEYSQWA